MPRVETIKAARKDYPNAGIKKGDTYYKWSFRFGGTHMSKTYPKRQQLTQSDFLIGLYDLEDRLAEISEPDDIDDIISDIRSLAGEQEDKLSNMPDGLQQGDTGQLLQERADELNQWADDLDNVDREIDEDGIKDEATREVMGDDYEPNPEVNLKEFPTEDGIVDKESEIEDLFQEKLQERKDEILNELKEIGHNL